MEAFAFPFLFLEVSPAFGAINGYGKIKSFSFYHTKLRRFARPRAKEERREEKKKRMEEMERCEWLRGDGEEYLGKGVIGMCEEERD